MPPPPLADPPAPHPSSAGPYGLVLRGASRDEDEAVAEARAAWLREIEEELPRRAREVLVGRRPDGRRWSRRRDTLCWRMRGERDAVFFKLGDLAQAARPTGLPTPRVLASGPLSSGSFVLIAEEAAGTRARDLVGTPRAAGLVSALARALREVHAGPCLPGALLGCFPEVPPERVQWMAALSRFLR